MWERYKEKLYPLIWLLLRVEVARCGSVFAPLGSGSTQVSPPIFVMAELAIAIIGVIGPVYKFTVGGESASAVLRSLDILLYDITRYTDTRNSHTFCH